MQAAAHGADSGELRQQAVQGGHDVAVQYRELLQLVMHILNKPTAESRAALPTVSRKIAQCVTVLAQTAELLKGADWVDPDDPMLIAENELLGAAQSIERAAKKLSTLKPRKEVTDKKVCKTSVVNFFLCETCVFPRLGNHGEICLIFLVVVYQPDYKHISLCRRTPTGTAQCQVNSIILYFVLLGLKRNYYSCCCNTKYSKIVVMYLDEAINDFF